MEIENHKEEVPFGHYEELFRKADPMEITGRLPGVKWDGKEFFLDLLGKRYAISHPKYGIREVAAGDGSFDSLRSLKMTGEGTLPGGSGKERKDEYPVPVVGGNLPLQTFLLRYLLESKDVAWQGSWKTFREMPWGELYIKPYTGRVLTRAAFTFATRLESFKAACQKMGAAAVSHGDAGYQFRLIGGYEMQILVWEGDDEFPPSAQVLYSDNFEQGFAPEDRVVAGDILITAVKGNM